MQINMQSLTIITWNIALLPDWICNFVHSTLLPNRERIQYIVQTILQTHPMIVMLQEAFDSEQNEVLIELFKQAQYQISQSNRHNKMMHCGQITFVHDQLTITNTQFIEFTNGYAEDKFGMKGMLITDVLIPFPNNTNKSVKIINIHLQNPEVVIGWKQTAQLIQQEQLQGCLSFFKELDNHHHVFIAGGDFNAYVECFHKSLYQSVPYTNDCIDYIVSNCPLYNSILLRDKWLSDHPAIGMTTILDMRMAPV